MMTVAGKVLDDLRRHAPILTVVLFLLQGCSADKFGIVISQDKLPNGWQLVKNSEMPTSDKTPFWTRNPQRVTGQTIREYFNVGSEPSRAQAITMVMYEQIEKDCAVVFFAHEYRNEQDASTELAAMKSNGIAKNGLAAPSLNSKKDFILMIPDDSCGDLSFFVSHFKSITAPCEK